MCPWQVCTTLGMLTPEQAAELRQAGLSAYNHNLDTSPEYYSQITTTRKYEVISSGAGPNTATSLAAAYQTLGRSWQCHRVSKMVPSSSPPSLWGIMCRCATGSARDLDKCEGRRHQRVCWRHHRPRRGREGPGRSPAPGASCPFRTLHPRGFSRGMLRIVVPDTP